jgi:hypothetical protein
LADQFNDALETFAVADSSLFTVMHLNIRSLTRNLPEYLLCLAHKFSIIGLSETWLNENSCLTQIPGYNFISQNRIGKSGGGVRCLLFGQQIPL